VLDSNKCISYLTIEAKGEIPEALRESIGELMYGCDICQEVCPWNHKFSRPLSELAFAARPALKGKDARALSRELLAMSASEFSAAFKGSPMKRAKLRGLKRNAAVVLGNVGSTDDVEVLRRSLLSDEAVVREHARSALAKIGTGDEGSS
jgi:epoxyqueuosine reductase